MAEAQEDPTECTDCGTTLAGGFYMCDRAPNKAWCGECFDKTDCGQEKHGEECPTKVWIT